MEAVPGHVSIVFILTTFVAIGFLLQAIKAAGLDTLPAKILLFLLPSWIIFQTVLASGGFYQDTSSFPPRLILIGIVPAVFLIVCYLLFFRGSFVQRMPLSLLTLLHVVRIPVELVLHWLSTAGAVPVEMTFFGWNFDIVTGILAVPAYLLAFRKSDFVRKPVVIAYNVFGLILLGNIVTIAALSIATPLQQFGLQQPNRAVLYFPYVWLPTVIVPIVLFSHLVSLYKVLFNKMP